MTLAGQQSEPDSSWEADLWNQLVYDCCCWEHINWQRLGGYKKRQECAEQSSPLREIMLPTVKALLRDMYETTLNNYLEHNKNYMMQSACDYMESNYIWTYLLLGINHETNNVEIIQRLIDVLAENFRLDNEMFYSESILDKVLNYTSANTSDDNIPYYHDFPAMDYNGTLPFPIPPLPVPIPKVNEKQDKLLSYKSCLQAYSSNFTQVAKAAFILLSKVYDESYSLFSLPRFLLKTADTRYYTDEESTLGSLKKQVSDSFYDLIKTSNISVEHISYMVASGAGCSECPDIKVALKDAYLATLKTMKYFLRPYDYRIRETSDSQDLKEAARKIFSTKYTMKNASNFTHHNPLILNCLFGHSPVVNYSIVSEPTFSYCNDMIRTFTNLGVGYTINPARFYDIYKKTSLMDIFCKEMVHSQSEDCKLPNKETQKPLKKIQVSGPKYALRLLLHIPKEEGYYSFQRLSIHHPKSMPFVSGSTIKPIPGMHTKVVVTPRVTMTDEALSQADVSKKKCFSTQYDSNPLILFNHYSQENCIFECRLKYAKNHSGCTPWGLPMFSKAETVCYTESEATVLATLQNTDPSIIDCSHCIDDCDKVDYEFMVSATPLQEICIEDEHIRKAVVQAAGIRGIEKYLDAKSMSDELFDFGESCARYAQESIAKVDVFVGPVKAVHITRSPRVTFLQQVANLGKCHKGFRLCGRNNVSGKMKRLGSETSVQY